MVVEPTAAHNTFKKLQKLARNCEDSFDFSSCADQILNRHFKRWHKLPQTYCSEVSSSFTYVPEGGDANTLSPEIRVSWFSGNTWKPWMLAVCEKERKVLCMGGGQVIPHLEKWVAIYDKQVLPFLTHKTVIFLNEIPRPLPKWKKTVSVVEECSVATLEKIALEEEVTRMNATCEDKHPSNHRRPWSPTIMPMMFSGDDYY
ncbi:PREDICTED: uncharacterized protein LOC106805638 isoform X2 [Priapulus caudatus]|nr:PREDICTED: uncharacterized protein LOC106805638 isoform X2 [Priapulus caudatus]